MSIKSYITNIFIFIKNLPYRYSIGGLVVLCILGLGGYRMLTQQTSTSNGSGLTTVTLSSVSNLSAGTTTIPLTGTITSLHQATILAQTSGEVVQVYKSLGDTVSAGAVIGAFENSSQAAAVVQAQGAYDAAQAALAKTQAGGTTNQKDISAIQNAQAQTSVSSALLGANNALQSAYATLDDAIHTKTDPLFTNPKSASPIFILSTSNSGLVNQIQNDRQTVEQKINDIASINAAVTDSSDVDVSISSAIADAQFTKSFLDNVVQALNNAIPSTTSSAATIAGYQANVTLARSNVVGVISSLNAAKASYDAAVAAAAVAGKQYADASNGGRSEDVDAAAANVKQALGALDGAQANFEKTIIRSPLSGTIVSLPIKTGSYVASFSQVAIVSNAKALQVVTYVTSDTAQTIHIGDTATIGDSGTGVITKIAPAIDPTTNKIEVDIGLTGDESSLTDGEIVTINLNRSAPGITTAHPTGTISIPIAAAKITPTGPIVFTVSSSTLVANPVTFGGILGDQVTILSGVTPQMVIVTDARGLSAGQVVIVNPGN